MKKLFAIFICAIMCVTLLTSCDKECANHVDDNEDGICDACSFEYEFLFKLTYDKSGYSLYRVGAGYQGGNIVIPSTHNGLPVVEIGWGAFKSDYRLTSVVIPEGVKSIGKFAYYNCTSVASVTLPKSVESIGLYAFSSQLRGRQVETEEEGVFETVDVEFITVDGSYAAEYIKNPPTAEVEK